MRRSIDELVTLYELEPDLNDVFVEGAFDYEVYERVAKSLSDNISVYEIDTVDIPAHILLKYGLTEGKKQRIIALSKEISHVEKKGITILLIDKDFDDWIQPFQSGKYLIRTHFSMTDMYFCEKIFVEKLITKYGKGKIPNFDLYFESLSQALVQVYAVRYAIEILKIEVTFPNLDKNISIKNGKIIFDSTRYVNAILNNNGIHDKRDNILDISKSFLDQQISDFRNASYGEDFFEILCWSIRQFRGEKDMCSTIVLKNMSIAHSTDFPLLVSVIGG